MKIVRVEMMFGTKRKKMARRIGWAQTGPLELAELLMEALERALEGSHADLDGEGRVRGNEDGQLPGGVR